MINFTMKYLKRKIIILAAAAILLSCRTVPSDHSADQSWLISPQKKAWATMTLLSVQIEKNGGWHSIEGEAAYLAPLYFWERGCRVVPAEEKPKYAARIWIRERDFTRGWKNKKSLTVEVHIWLYEDAPVNGALIEEYKLPAAVGKIIMTGDISFSSSFVMRKMLSKAVTKAVRRLVVFNRRLDALNRRAARAALRG